MKYELLSVDKLELDVQNPRVARILDMYQGQISHERMKLALVASAGDDSTSGTTFHSLRESIKTNGGIIHPIIVNQTADQRLVVIEGNTRTMIYREFKDSGIEGNWNTIPSLVHFQLSQAEIDAIRLQAHLVGPREWDAYSKGKYLNYLRNSKHLTFSQIVDFYGGNRREVERYIDAYNDMEHYYRPVVGSDSEFDQTKFSSFVELQRIAGAVVEAGHTKSDFAEWVNDGLLTPQAQVWSLPRILKNSKAKAIFLQDGAQEAVKAIDGPSTTDALKDANFTQLLIEIKRRIWDMPYGELIRLKETVGSPENDVILEARDALTDLCRDMASDE